MEPRVGTTLRVENLSKSFGPVQAVKNASFTARPGRVTGFLGPNGSGKSTTLRMIVGLIKPANGRVTINETPYSQLKNPMREVGAMLDANCVHPGRSGRDHLRTWATYSGVTDARVDEVLDIVGLASAGRRSAGGYSLGMRQRLALGTALLADPSVLILDEPVNGLDPQGIVWLRDLLQELAVQGRTVLVSSHALSEVENTVDDVVIISSGRIVHASSLDELADSNHRRTIVETPSPERFKHLADSLGWETRDHGSLEVLHVDPRTIGEAMFRAEIIIHALVPANPSLEDVFFRLVSKPDENELAGSSPDESGSEARG